MPRTVPRIVCCTKGDRGISFPFTRKRTRGGAVLIARPQLEAYFEVKDHTAKKEKDLIGRYVASLISENDTVLY